MELRMCGWILGWRWALHFVKVLCIRQCKTSTEKMAALLEFQFP